MHELLVSILIISLTMFLLCSGKVKRLALKEKKSMCCKCISNAKAETNSPMATVYGRRSRFFKNISFIV